MDITGPVARAVALVGATMVQIRRLSGVPSEQAFGGAPVIPKARPQGMLPTLKMPTARGWRDGETPVAAPGLKVNAFATGLDHPRWIEVADDGSVLVAESLQPKSRPSGLFDLAMQATLRRAGSAGETSANRITRFRDLDGDGVGEVRDVFMEGLNQPIGMARIGDTFYVGNTDGVFAHAYPQGADKPAAEGRRLTTFRTRGHWTRSLIASPDGSKLYCGVGSLSNIGDDGMEVEEGRAAVWEIDVATGTGRIFASGLRNPVGLAFEPGTGVLWTVVNERDGLGDETPPDYLTSVVEGGFYGWPYCYWDRIVDDRVPQDAAMVARALTPDYALGGHTASLGLCWHPAGTLPGFPDGMIVGQHGSWNRSTLSGYRVIFVPFANGRPSGPGRDVLTGFLSADESYSSGRPVGVAIGRDGSLLVADDVGNAVWRVTGA